MRVFVTGASGWIGTATVTELVGAGHRVLGLARSPASADALAELGAEVHHGDLDDLDALQQAAAATDGVIHLAFKHDIAFTGDFAGAVTADRQAIEALGAALVDSGRPLVIASGVLVLAPGRVATEEDGQLPEPGAGGFHGRLGNAQLTLSYADRGIRSSVVRLAPTVHGAGDQGFVAALVGVARERGVSGYVEDGTYRWPTVHRDDAARLFRMALEAGPAGSTWHAVAEEGVRIRDLAGVIGRDLDMPVVSVPSEEAEAHFGFLAGPLAIDSPASSALTRARLGWQPTRPTLLEDLDAGSYFR